ncbi:unnamed protein product [Acanthoscelides obtectus]|uniref:N-terminal acetyltransferase B complex subunit MDM20 homolog n=1 Tax=Acanthoscelides obtectus TaxID=200917 RepID=A0A9P0PH06_ACAOB|nr:unnamed protein product [Acanthoscelides obtectus]CAK1666446.1 Phagocyte signaling-impaired protein [Acanthoscelides obtectus]
MSRAAPNMHVQPDSSVVERRLRPIYDWLDIGNNKKALQECDKVLKKTPNLHCAKALKALTLNRMGKEYDSQDILEALVKENPTDDATLQAITLCYREMQELEKVCKLYETAVKSDPRNEELHTHLFMSYVRISDFKSQQQSAMSLYKLKPKNPYYCWAIMSIILQATRGEGSTDPKKRMLLLSLAERMFSKMITDNKIDAEQEVQLYIMILELLEKYEEILAVIDSPLGSKLQSTNIPQTKLKYLKALKKWNEVNLVCKDILIDSIDRWDIWRDYINSVFELMGTTTSDIIVNDECDDNTDAKGDSLETIDDTPEKAHEFICRIVENGTENGYLLRGPYLARFELCSRLSEKDMCSADLLGETIELFIEYFRKFGHKPCCVSDLRVYLNLLNDIKKAELATRLIKDVGISSTTIPQSEHQMQRHICALQLARLCGSHRNLPADHLKALVTALSLHYQHGYQAYGKNLLPTDLGASDPYALIAAHILHDLAQTQNNSEFIILALMLLDSLLKNSPSNFHAKLLAIRLYHLVGGGICAHDMYNSLDVKHLQLDSLGYIHCARLPTTGLFTLCTNLFDTTLKFFASNYKDSSEYLTFSYKFGSFIKMNEFLDFRERLNNSLHYTTVAVDKIVLSLVECMSLETLYTLSIPPKEYNVEWELLRDNHDLNVYMSWDPERIESAPEDWKDTKQLFKQNILFLKLRNFAIQTVAIIVDISLSTDGTRLKHLEILKNTVADWKILFEKAVSENLAPISEQWTDSVTIEDLSQRLEALHLSTSQNIVDNILHSYTIANKELQLILKTKVKMLSNISR